MRADAAFPVAHPACARLETATIHLIADQLLEHGIATPEEIDAPPGQRGCRDGSISPSRR